MKGVLLIHGLLSDQHDFDPLYDSLYNLYDKVKAVSLPGHGDLQEISKFTVEDTYKTVISAYDELNQEVSSIDVIGYSMGGALAIYLSSIRHINSLILLAPACKCFNFYLPITKAASYLSLYQKLWHAKIFKYSLSEYKYQDKLKAVKEDDKKSRWYLKNRFLKLKVPYYYYIYQGVIRIVNQEVKAITVPTLILWGELDQLVPRKAISYCYSLCKNDKTKVVIYDDICHLMLLSQKHDKIIKDILNFIE